jgi:hypothetical protein
LELWSNSPQAVQSQSSGEAAEFGRLTQTLANVNLGGRVEPGKASSRTKRREPPGHIQRLMHGLPTWLTKCFNRQTSHISSGSDLANVRLRHDQ